MGKTDENAWTNTVRDSSINRRRGRNDVDGCLLGSGHQWSAAAVFYWIFYLFVGLLAACVTIRYFFITNNDPMGCRSVLQGGGRWLDPAEKGYTTSFTKWQPKGCALHEYSFEEASTCLNGSHLVFAGDSTIRGVYNAVQHLVPGAGWSPKFTKSVHETIGSSIDSRMYWDSFLDAEIGKIEKQVAEFQSEASDSEDLLLVGTGLHPLKFSGDRYLDTVAKGLGNFLRSPKSYNTSLSANGLLKTPSRHDSWIIMPVNILSPSDIRADRKSWAILDKVLAMNELIRNMTDNSDTKVAWSFVDMLMYKGAILANDGIHNQRSIDIAKLNVLLNYRCNARLASVPSVELLQQGSCCLAYPGFGFTQGILILVALFAVSVAAFRHHPAEYLRSANAISEADLESHHDADARAGVRGLFQIPQLHVTHRASILPAVLLCTSLYCVLADGSWMLEKESRFFMPTNFFIFLGLLCFTALVSIGPIRLDGDKEPESHRKRMFRAITDEWKGCLSLVLCILEWNAAPPSIMDPVVQLSLISFPFLLGLGDTAYILGTHDFKKCLSRIVHLNALSAVLFVVLPRASRAFLVTGLLTAGMLFVHGTMVIFLRVRHSAGHDFGVAATAVHLFIANVLPLLVPFSATANTISILNQRTVTIGMAGLSLGVVFAMARAEMHSAERVKCSRMSRTDSWQICSLLGRPATLLLIVAGSGLVIYYMVSLRLQGPLSFVSSGPSQSIILHLLLTIFYAWLRPYLLPAYSSRVLRCVGRHALEFYVLRQHIWLAANGNLIMRLGLLRHIFSGVSPSNSSVVATARFAAIEGTFDLIILSIVLAWLCGAISKETQALGGSLTNIMSKRADDQVTESYLLSDRSSQDDSVQSDLNSDLELKDEESRPMMMREYRA